MSVTSPNRRWMSPPPTYDANTPSHMSTTSLTPYLQLPHLLSLTWLAYPILSLVFVAFRLQLSLSSSQDAVANAKGDLLTSCKAAERAATAAASMPRYMALATNQQFAEAVNGSMNAARAALVLSLTVMEGVINFIVDLYRSTFLCFLELVVRGGLAILIAAVQEFSTFLQNTASSIRTSIQNDIASANSAIQSAIDGVNKVNPFGNIAAPQITVPSLTALENVTLPTTFQDSLTKLNSTIPTVADLKEKVEAVIDKPFELLKKDINDTFAGISFEVSGLPVPKTNLLTFCDDLDTSIVDDLGRDLIKIAKIGTLILILLALLLVALNCLLEWYKWRCMKRHLEYTRQAWISDPTMYYSHPAAGSAPKVTLSDHNLLMLQASGSHPLLTRISNTLSTRLHLSPSQYTHLQWFFNYIFHPPALACFLIGFFGLLSVQIQLFAMGPLVAKYSDRTASSVSDFSNTIATSINNSMYNQSSAYANDVNGRVDAMQSTINQGVFGWVNGTTTTLNTTIAEFYNDIQTAVSTVFNGTILEQPAQEFIKCLIGTKVDAIENGLTFMHDNLKVDMPRMNQTVLILSQSSVDETTKPIAAAAIGGGADDDQGLIGRLVNTYAEGLKKERLMFGIFMGLWGFVVLMGLAVVLWHSYGRQLLERRKRRRWEREQRSGIDGIVVPFRDGMQAGDEKGSGNRTNLPSFTPLPSPKASGFNPFFLNHSAPSTDSNDSNHSRSVESLNKPQSEKSWDSFFGKKNRGKITANAISKPMKLMTIGQKAMGRERFTGNNESSREASSSSEQSQLETRNTAWFGRIATMLGRKQPESTGSISDQGSFRERARPNLRISIDRASSMTPDFPRLDNHITENDHDQNGLNSRWSASPEATRRLTPWINRITPIKSAHLQSPPPGLPSHPKPRHNANVPSDVNSVYEDLVMVPRKPTPLALPLHHGFDRSRSQSGPNARIPVTPPPMESPTYYLQPLAPPPRKHRRSSSVPDWKMPNDNDTSITPVTRLLTTTHARQSSSVNPFVTPFDDEHRVTINHASHASDVRKSIPTNPFAAIAL